MSQALVFQQVTFDVIDHNGQPWIQSRQLAIALGYKDESSVRKLYERNADEFTAAMTATVNLTVGITPVEVRIFSLRGCHLIAMLARTLIAKAFRVWVLDVLSKLEASQQPALPETTTPSTPADRKPLRSLVYAWSVASGIHVSALWPQVRAHFQLERIDDLPVEWIPQALAFAQGKIDELGKTQQKALPPAGPPVLSQPAMSRVDIDRLHMEMREHMRKAMDCGSKISLGMDGLSKKMTYTAKHNVVCYLGYSFNSFADAWEAIAEAMKSNAKAMAYLQSM